MRPDRKSSEPNVIALAERRGEAAAPPGPEAESPRRGRRSLSWWLGVALALATALLVGQLRRAGRLAERVEALTIEVDAARTAVDSYRSRMETVRAHVSGLSAQLGELERLVEPDPEEAGP